MGAWGAFQGCKYIVKLLRAENATILAFESLLNFLAGLVTFCKVKSSNGTKCGNKVCGNDLVKMIG